MSSDLKYVLLAKNVEHVSIPFTIGPDLLQLD